MMNEQIKYVGNVKIDYTYYNEQIKYSDGDIEDILLDAAKEGKLNELLGVSGNWSVLYHCSKIRENILEWYPFKKNASLLEIGSGCGALTGLFSRKVDQVTCIEISEKRSMINAYRNRECSNVLINLGSFEDIEINEKYDYITLIGVWEYASQYIITENPYEDMLRYLQKYLKKDGVILIAIENKLGIKYWNGAVEDHCSELYAGLNDYVNSSYVRTFSKPEIENILKNIGYSSYKFYYPFPDYKLADTIYSDMMMPQPGEIRNHGKNYDTTHIYNFYEDTIADQICSDKKMDYFSNSFLIEIGNNPSDVMYVKYNNTRKDKYNIRTVIEDSKDGKTVRKTAQCEAAQCHLQNMKKNEQNGIGKIKGLTGVISNYEYIVPFIEGQSIDAMLYPLRNNINLFIKAINELKETYLEANASWFIPFVKTQEFIDFFGDIDFESEISLPNPNIDLILSNFRVSTQGELYNIDKEWILPFPVPFSYIWWRSVSQIYKKYLIYLRGHISQTEFLKKCGIKDNIDNFVLMENKLVEEVYQKHYLDGYRKESITCVSQFR